MRDECDGLPLQELQYRVFLRQNKSYDFTFLESHLAYTST